MCAACDTDPVGSALGTHYRKQLSTSPEMSSSRWVVFRWRCLNWCSHVYLMLGPGSMLPGHLPKPQTHPVLRGFLLPRDANPRPLRNAQLSSRIPYALPDVQTATWDLREVGEGNPTSSPRLRGFPTSRDTGRGRPAWRGTLGWLPSHQQLAARSSQISWAHGGTHLKGFLFKTQKGEGKKKIKIWKDRKKKKKEKSEEAACWASSSSKQRWFLGVPPSLP